MSLNRIAVLAVLVSILFSPSLLADVIPNTEYDSFYDATVYNGALYVFYGSYSLSLDKYYTYYNSSFDGVNWAPAPTSVPIPSAAYQAEGIAVAAFNGRLYLFWHTLNSRSIYYISMDQFGVWDTVATRIPNATADRELEAIVFNNRLYVMWRATDNNTSLFYNSMSTAGTWGTNARLSSGESSDGPAAAILRMSDGVEYLYAYWQDRADFDAGPMWYARMSATSGWSATTKLATSDYPLTESRPTAVSDGNKIDLIYKGGYSNAYYLKEMSKTGTWTHESTMPLSSPVNPEAIRFNGATWVFYYANSAINTYTYY
jgi:hypothetical protein